MNSASIVRSAQCTRDSSVSHDQKEHDRKKTNFSISIIFRSTIRVDDIKTANRYFCISDPKTPDFEVIKNSKWVMDTSNRKRLHITKETGIIASADFSIKQKDANKDGEKKYDRNQRIHFLFFGRGGGIRTPTAQDQNLVHYRYATPQ